MLPTWFTVLLNFFFSGSCKGGVGLVCDSYHIDRGIRNGTETCQNVDDHCFVLWGKEETGNNETVHRVIKKGCFKIALHSNFQHCCEDCIQNPDYDAFKSQNVSGFCCCTKDLCNVNFTAVEYTEYESTVTPTTRKGELWFFSLVWFLPFCGTNHTDIQLVQLILSDFKALSLHDKNKKWYGWL